MGYWEYTQSSGRKSAKKNTRRLSEDLDAWKDTIYRQIKTLGKSYRSWLHELTPQHALRRVDICRQLIGNPMDDRFIRRIVTCEEKWVSYRSLDQDSQPCNTTGNIIVLYVLTLSFLESRRDDTIFSSTRVYSDFNFFANVV